MRTAYVPHIFGEDVDRRLRSRRGWLTAGVSSSIAWPSLDVCVIYAGDEFYLRGSERGGQPSPPGITIACSGDGGVDDAISRIYRFTSVLGYKNSRAHIDLDNSGLLKDTEFDVSDVRSYYTIFYNVLSNRIVELRCEKFEPVDCEVVIPVNMMMTKSADDAIEEAVERFKSVSSLDRAP